MHDQSIIRGSIIFVMGIDIYYQPFEDPPLHCYCCLIIWAEIIMLLHHAHVRAVHHSTNQIYCLNQKYELPETKNSVVKRDPWLAAVRVYTWDGLTQWIMNPTLFCGWGMRLISRISAFCVHCELIWLEVLGSNLTCDMIICFRKFNCAERMGKQCWKTMRYFQKF